MTDVEIGSRIRLLYMGNDPDPVPPGTEGVVNYVGPVCSIGQQIGVKWDDGRTLMLIVGEDRFELV